MTADDCARRLAGTAAALYRDGFARRRALARMTRDPLFATLLRSGAIPDAACLIDLGCGQGLLAAWLHAARAAWTVQNASADWPADWPAAPKVSTYLGIDRSRRDIGRARAALPPFARVFRGDLRTLGTTLLDRCDVVTLIDVLHDLAPAAQEALIAAVAAGLPPWGVLVLRVDDGGTTAGKLRSRLAAWLTTTWRGQRFRRSRRTIADWTTLLEAHGFRVEVLDDPGAGNDRTFANVLLRASRPSTDTPAVTASLR